MKQKTGTLWHVRKCVDIYQRLRDEAAQMPFIMTTDHSHMRWCVRVTDLC